MTASRLPWGVIGPMLLVLGWEVLARLPAAQFVIAPPSDIVLYISQNEDLFGRALVETLTNALAGFAIGNLAAILLATLAITLPRSEPLVRGLALLVFCLPIVATGPILRVVFGPGPWPQIVLSALAVYYTTLIPLLVGLRAVPGTWLDVVRSYGRGRLAALLHIRIFASVPHLVAGLQIAAPAAFLGAMVGEFTGAERGMGVLMIRSMRAMDIDMTWSLAAIATGVAIAGFLAIGWAARPFMKEPPPTLIAAPVMARRPGLWTPLLVGAVALAIWWAGLQILGLNAFFAKGPQHVFTALVLAADAAQTRATLVTALGETAVYLVPGYLAGLGTGALLAMLVVQVPAIAGTANSLAIALRSVPIVTTAPLVVLALGRGTLGTLVVVAIMVFFPAFLSCLQGLKQAPGQIIDVMKSYGANATAQLLYLRLPAMLPAFFGAARICVPASVLAITVVEWLSTGRGIGSLMALSASVSDYDMLWSAVVLVAVLSVIGYGVVSFWEQRVLATYAPEQLQ